jgi:hypothetical protein
VLQSYFNFFLDASFPSFRFSYTGEDFLSIICRIMSFTGDTAHVERRPTWGRSLADNDTQEGVDMAVGERELDRLSKFPTSDSVARAPGEDEKQLFETSVEAGDLERGPNIPLPLEEAMLEA